VIKVNTEGSSYFGLKNYSLEVASPDEIVVFCDSDCRYENDFILKLSDGFSEASIEVVFGTTYAYLIPQSFKNKCIALTWQFPLDSIGYQDSWPESIWANNFAVRASTLRKLNFPEFRLTKLNSRDILYSKISLIVWRKALAKQGAAISYQDAKSYHRVFPTLAEFSSWQFHNGLSIASHRLYRKEPFRKSMSTLVIERVGRLVHLVRLWRKALLTPAEFLYSGALVAYSLVLRAGGVLAFKSYSLEIREDRLGMFRQVNMDKIQ
jgi:hypothetical protein